MIDIHFNIALKMTEKYLESVTLIEKIYRLYLDVLKSEIQKMGVLDLNHTQAMILFHVGERKISISEIVDKGHFVGSNVSYNVKKLGQAGYLQQEASEFDKRTVHISLTRKGKEIKNHLRKSVQSHGLTLSKHGLGEKELDELNELLHKMAFGLGKLA